MKLTRYDPDTQAIRPKRDTVAEKVKSVRGQSETETRLKNKKISAGSDPPEPPDRPKPSGKKKKWGPTRKRGQRRHQARVREMTRLWKNQPHNKSSPPAPKPNVTAPRPNLTPPKPRAGGWLALAMVAIEAIYEWSKDIPLAKPKEAAFPVELEGQTYYPARPGAPQRSGNEWQPGGSGPRIPED